MKLKRLIIQGFKSFKDRTTVHFDDGITGIVGPNGCGKSNIVDALFWVMGEQSAKHLRGNSMKDLIFAGSSKYNPGSWAEATLVLENTEGKHIHIGNKVASPSEISLTRKLYRNGDTEYRINGEPARLKDIQEVFMDTGAGAKSYSIIAQGEINRLVQAKPVERRTMIEEVAGITKFKLRKRESMRKIEATESNLARLQDLQTEIEKNLRALSKQAEKAERARNLKEKIKRNDLVVHSHKVFDLMKNYRDSKVAINEKTIELESWRLEKDDLEVSLADERIQKDERTAQIEEYQKEFNEISKSLAAAEERLNSLCNTQSQKEKELETREKEIEELKEELKGREEKLQELTAKKDEAVAENQKEHNFEEMEDVVSTLKHELEIKEIELEDARNELSESKDSKNTIDQEVFKVNSRLEEFASNLQDLNEELEELEKQYSSVSTQISDERDLVSAAEEKVAELEEAEKTSREEIAELTSFIRENESNFNAKNKELIQLESKKSSLIEINNSLEGASAGASEFLASDRAEGYSIIGNLIKSDESVAKGVQALLSDFINTLVSKEDDLSSLRSWLDENDKGIDFLIAEPMTTSSETIERLRVNGFDSIQKLTDAVTIDSAFEAKVASLFEGYFIVDELDFEKFEELSSSINFKAIATKDGSRVIRNVGNAKNYTYIPAGEEAMGYVERNNLIEELTKTLETLEVEVQELESTLETKKEELSTKEEAFDNLRDQLAEVRSDYALKKGALESKLKSMESGNSRLEILKNRKNEISKSRLELLERKEKLDSELKNFDSNVEAKSEAIKELAEAVDSLRADYKEKNEEFVAKQVEIQSFKDRLESYTSQIEDINSQIEKQTKRIESNQELINQYSEDITKIEEELKSLEDSNRDTATTLSEKEEALSEMKDGLGELLLQMQEREDKVKKLNQSITKNEKEIIEHNSKIESAITDEEQITRDIFEKYQIDLREVIGKFLEYEQSDYEGLNDLNSMYTMETENGPKEIEKQEYTFNRRYGQDLKDCSYKLKSYKTEYNRLGDINWQAIEDYERQKLRFDFLKVQEEELKKSLEDLERAIAHIDEKSKQRFKIAFEDVNTRFQKVFPIIFGGGNARLEVRGNLDDAECGVDIIAQPPGKKMQNINLMSGGEKALTAVSLIFSIFLVKPSPFCLLDEVDAPLDDANVGRFNELLREMSKDSQFILITHNKKTMELNDTLYGVTMQEPGISKAVSVQLH